MIAMDISKAADEIDITAQAIHDHLKENLKHLTPKQRDGNIDRVLLVADKDEYLTGLKDGWNIKVQRRIEVTKRRANSLADQPTREHWQKLHDMGAKLLEEEKAQRPKNRVKKGGWKRKLKKRLGIRW